VLSTRRGYDGVISYYICMVRKKEKHTKYMYIGRKKERKRRVPNIKERDNLFEHAWKNSKSDEDNHIDCYNHVLNNGYN